MMCIVQHASVFYPLLISSLLRACKAKDQTIFIWSVVSKLNPISSFIEDQLNDFHWVQITKV